MDFAENAGVDEEFLTVDQAYERVFTTTNGFEHVFAAQTSLSPEPKNWKDALKRPDKDLWIQSAWEEITQLIANGTWEPVRLPPGRKTIGCRWVFKLK